MKPIFALAIRRLPARGHGVVRRRQGCSPPGRPAALPAVTRSLSCREDRGPIGISYRRLFCHVNEFKPRNDSIRRRCRGDLLDDDSTLQSPHGVARSSTTVRVSKPATPTIPLTIKRSSWLMEHQLPAMVVSPHLGALLVEQRSHAPHASFVLQPLEGFWRPRGWAPVSGARPRVSPGQNPSFPGPWEGDWKGVPTGLRTLAGSCVFAASTSISYAFPSTR